MNDPNDSFMIGLFSLTPGAFSTHGLGFRLNRQYSLSCDNVSVSIINRHNIVLPQNLSTKFCSVMKIQYENHAQLWFS